MQEQALWLVLFAMVVIGVASACRRFGLPSPLVLTVVGIIGSYLPFIPHDPLEPDVILVGLLPPLLYAAAIQVSLVDIRRDTRAIVLLAVGLVIATALAVGLVGWLVAPIPLAAALALGAVVGPPDAVAATAIGRRIGLPRRVVTLLEGESLLNDATAIVLLHTTIAAIVGTVTAADLAGGFAMSVIGGGAVGLLVAFVVGKIHARLEDAVTATALSLVTPWIAYLPAEEIHGSGVLAVVVAGLILAYKSPVQQSAMTRLSQRINWATIQFFLENAVFLMVGLQLAGIVRGVAGSDLGLGRIVLFCVAVFATTVLVRPLWMWVSLMLRRRAVDRLSGRELGVVSWAGMRGVVTLAAVLTLPESTPHRELLVLAAMVVVAGTLLLQGATLPWAARRLGVEGPDPRADVLAAAQVMRSATNAGLATLDRVENNPEYRVPVEAIEDLRQRTRRRADAMWEELRGRSGTGGITPGQTFRKLRLKTLAAERDEVLRIRNEGNVDHEVLSAVMNALDIEEAMLHTMSEQYERTSSAAAVARGGPVAAPVAVTGACEHLAEAECHPDPEPLSSTCLECLRDGANPVHLRICLTCGYVGCCDSSVGMHSTAHFEQSGHPVMRSFEAHEVWRWCYVDELLG